MNLNPHPDWSQPTRWSQVRTPSSSGNPLPRWARWLAAALIFAGYGALEYQDHIIEQAIQQSTQGAARK